MTPAAQPVLNVEISASDFEAFVRGYVNTMLYSTNDESDPSGGDPLSHNYSEADLTPLAMVNVRETCARFVDHAFELLIVAVEKPGYSWEQAGNDLWYTSAGHGVGYWDRDQISGDHLGWELSDRCSNKEMNVQLTDDGTIDHWGPAHDYMSAEQRVERERQVLRATLDEASSPAVSAERARSRL